jgi:hypothetical protein
MSIDRNVIPFDAKLQPEPRKSRRKSNVVNIVGALRIIDLKGAEAIAEDLSPLRTVRDREAGVGKTMRDARRLFRDKGLRGAELDGALIVAEALVRKEMNRRAREWRLPS